MSDDTSVCVGPGPGAYLPVPVMDSDVFGSLQATRMDVAGTEVLVYQEVDKSYLRERLEEPVRPTASATPVFVVGDIDNDIPPPTPNNNIPPPTPQVVKPPPKNKIVPLEPPEKNLQCPICLEILPDDESFAVHFRIHPKKDSKHACFMCDYTTVNKTMFQEHIYMHQGIKPYKCGRCEHRCGSKRNLKIHEQLHPKQNCPNCGHFIKTQRKLEKHMETCRAKVVDPCESLTIACSKCNLTMNKYAMERHKCHRKKVRLTQGEVTHKPTKEKLNSTFVCQICKWSSRTGMKVLLHLIHHPKQKVDEKAIDITILKEHGIMD